VVVEIVRKDGNDGVISCEYELEEATEAPEKQRAIPGEDFEVKSGTVTFKHQETSQRIEIKLFPAKKEPTDGIHFYVRLFRPTPQAVKVNSKNNGRCRVEFVSDEIALNKSKAEIQLLESVQRQEEPTVADQLKEACMLYPTKNEDGEIEDVTAMEALLHLVSIGWKVLFAFIPPKHILGGWPCFLVSLAFIGVITAILLEVAELFGCVIGLKPEVTAFTFVAIGTSLPDTFVSRMSAREDKYADAAIGNITGSNSVIVFLGLGLPWVIGSVYYESHNEK